MWNFALFLPAAVLLALLAISLTRGHAAPSLGRVGALAIGLWLASWFAVVAVLYARSAGSLSSSFVAQRELGYWFGSALFMVVPFIAVVATGQLLSRTHLPWSVRSVSRLWLLRQAYGCSLLDCSLQGGSLVVLWRGMRHACSAVEVYQLIDRTTSGRLRPPTVAAHRQR